MQHISTHHLGHSLGQHKHRGLHGSQSAPPASSSMNNSHIVPFESRLTEPEAGAFQAVNDHQLVCARRHFSNGSSRKAHPKIADAVYLRNARTGTLVRTVACPPPRTPPPPPALRRWLPWPWSRSPGWLRWASQPAWRTTTCAEAACVGGSARDTLDTVPGRRCQQLKHREVWVTIKRLQPLSFGCGLVATGEAPTR